MKGMIGETVARSRCWMVCVLTLFWCTAASGQSGLRGRVTDPAGRTVTGACVVLDSGTARTFSNIHGRFLIRHITPGPHTLTVALVGYRRVTKDIMIPAEDSTGIMIILVPVVYSLEGIEVTAASRTATDPSSSFSVTSLQPAEIRKRAGAAEDLLRTLQSYPGVSSPNDFTTQLIVRGGAPEQNLFIMDGIEVINPYRLYGVVSMYNPETVEHVRLLSGGFPARYSDRLSAVVDVTNRDGSLTEDGFNARANLSLTNLNVVAEGAFLLESAETDDSARADLFYAEDSPPWNGSWLVSTRRTYYDLVAAPIVKSAGLAQGEVVLPTFQDFQFRLSLQPDYRHKIVFTGITNRDRAHLEDATAAGSLERISLDDLTFNDVAGIQWTWTHAPDVVGRYGVSFTQNGGSNQFSGIQNSATSFGLDLSTDEYNRLRDSLRAAGIDAPTRLPSRGAYDFLFRKFSANATVIWKAASSHTLEAGLILHRILTDLRIGVRLDPRLTTIRSSNFRFSTLPEAFSATVNSTTAGAFIQDAYQPLDGLAIEAGVRFDHFGMIGRTTVAPRLALRWEWDAFSALRWTWGLYYQSPGYEKSFLPGYETYITSTTYDLSGERPRTLRPEVAVHSALAWETLLGDNWQLRIEAYHKKFSDLVYPAIVRGTISSSTRTGSADPADPAGWTDPVAVPGDSLTTMPANSGTGLSYGGEIIIQKLLQGNTDPFYGWISYAYGKATRTRNGWTYPFEFDRRHSINLALGWRCAPWLDVNVSFVYGSGFPSTPPVGFGPRLYQSTDSTTGTITRRIDTDWRGVVFVSDRGGLRNLNSGRLPAYVRCDARVTTYATWFNWDWSLYLDIVNVSNHRNVALMEYYVDRSVMDFRTIETHMLPLLPSIGCTISF